MGKPGYGRQFQAPFGHRIRHEARVPTMTVGNISSPADVNTILAAGRADLVVLARGTCGTRTGLAMPPRPWVTRYPGRRPTRR